MEPSVEPDPATLGGVSTAPKLASELIASVDGPPDSGWDEAWQAELIRREDAAAARAEPAPEWSMVRARILAKLATR
jgi:hypothetical protein